MRNDCCGDVYLSHDRSASLFDGRDGTVDQKVSLCRKTLCHRRHNGDHIFVKISVICTCNIAVSADFGRVEVFDPIRHTVSSKLEEVSVLPVLSTNQIEALKYSLIADNCDWTL